MQLRIRAAAKRLHRISRDFRYDSARLPKPKITRCGEVSITSQLSGRVPRVADGRRLLSVAGNLWLLRREEAPLPSMVVSHLGL